VRGTLHDITPAAGTQLQCYCDDCRRAIVWLGQPDPGEGGVTYYQTTPNRVCFEKGGDSLRAFTWKNPKLLRWYAPCCNTPLLNTLNSPKWAFVSVITNRIDDAASLGPVKTRAFIPQGNGKRTNEGLIPFLAGFAKRVISGRLSGDWKVTPFFTPDGTPTAPIQRLSHTDRAKAPL